MNVNKKLLCAALFIVSVTTFAHGAPNRPFAAGIVIGSPTGINGKYWIDSNNAIDAVISVVEKNEAYLHADYLWHDYKAFPEPEEGKLPLYYGAGVRVQSTSGIGLRGVIGINYLFADYPFDIFLELAPVLTFNDGAGLHFSGGLGGRYYFGQ
ncbi:MAG: hypothetical protein A2219_06675 [Elusimicrobia bacterium RIFOXYA2_FULL_50_26]|nr:MAG: hypothetical protein A2219_06675 [Elusimicrobia bacterium RIFOXYA2_FULL_50_26]OGS25046.1 MAG: hypothetical protein A2314_01935 [Elusimicrobia bacterium RIFOXYB2_FULL_50_12]